MITALFPPEWSVLSPTDDANSWKNLVDTLPHEAQITTDRFFEFAISQMMSNNVGLLGTFFLPGAEADPRFYTWMAIHSGATGLGVPLDEPNTPFAWSGGPALKISGTYVTPRLPTSTTDDPCFGARYWLRATDDTYFEVTCEMFTAQCVEAVGELWDAIVAGIEYSTTDAPAS